jgi:hypothetical protein
MAVAAVVAVGDVVMTGGGGWHALRGRNRSDTPLKRHGQNTVSVMFKHSFSRCVSSSCGDDAATAPGRFIE